MESETKSVADVLEEAKRLIEEKTWAQRSEVFDLGCICAGLAIQKANIKLRGSWQLGVAAYQALGATFGGDENAVVEWNDAPGRTKEEVLAAFSRAIAQARGDAEGTHP